MYKCVSVRWFITTITNSPLRYKCGVFLLFEFENGKLFAKILIKFFFLFFVILCNFLSKRCVIVRWLRFILPGRLWNVVGWSMGVERIMVMQAWSRKIQEFFNHNYLTIIHPNEKFRKIGPSGNGVVSRPWGLCFESGRGR